MPSRSGGAAGGLVLALALAGAASAVARAQDAPAPPPLRVSDNGRFLVTDDGRPFFWLGDTVGDVDLAACRRRNGCE
jgi:hypothetical protein